MALPKIFLLFPGNSKRFFSADSRYLFVFPDSSYSECWLKMFENSERKRLEFGFLSQSDGEHEFLQYTFHVKEHFLNILNKIICVSSRSWILYLKGLFRAHCKYVYYVNKEIEREKKTSILYFQFFVIWIWLCGLYATIITPCNFPPDTFNSFFKYYFS